MAKSETQAGTTNVPAAKPAEKPGPSKPAEGTSEKPKLAKIRATSLDVDSANARIKEHWSKNSKQEPPEVVAKSYKVRALGSDAASLLPVIVENCCDEGDALSTFFRHYNVSPNKRRAVAERVA